MSAEMSFPGGTMRAISLSYRLCRCGAGGGAAGGGRVGAVTTILGSRDGQKARRRKQGCGGNRALPRQRGAPVRRSERSRLADSSDCSRDGLVCLSWADGVRKGVHADEYFSSHHQVQAVLLAQHPRRECASSRNCGWIKDLLIEDAPNPRPPAFASCLRPWPRLKDTRGSTNQPALERGSRQGAGATGIF